jgi:hypothetical protein
MTVSSIGKVSSNQFTRIHIYTSTSPNIHFDVILPSPGFMSVTFYVSELLRTVLGSRGFWKRISSGVNVSACCHRVILNACLNANQSLIWLPPVYTIPPELPEKCFSDACFYRHKMATSERDEKKSGSGRKVKGQEIVSFLLSFPAGVKLRIRADEEMEPHSIRELVCRRDILLFCCLCLPAAISRAYGASCFFLPHLSVLHACTRSEISDRREGSCFLS